MTDWYLKPLSKQSKVQPPLEMALMGDKSISHRMLMLMACIKGTSFLSGVLESLDVQATIYALRALGVSIKRDQKGYQITGVSFFHSPSKSLNIGNSGTSIRLLTGLLVGRKIEAKLIGDASIAKRPMGRVLIPLKKMGACVQAQSGTYTPIHIKPTKSPLQAIDYTLPVPSAQVKSAILLAGLSAVGETRLVDPFGTRDHTERLLQSVFDYPIVQTQLPLGSEITLTGEIPLKAVEMTIPKDVSAAAFWVLWGLLNQRRSLHLNSVGLNSTRTGYLRLLERMGANINVTIEQTQGEPSGSIEVSPSELVGISISSDDVIGAIDEIPVMMLAAAFAKGTTIIQGIQELRLKESDRVESVSQGLKNMGITCQLIDDSIMIEGKGNDYHFSESEVEIDSFQDHRVAMGFAIVAMRAKKGMKIRSVDCVQTSFPDFRTILLTTQCVEIINA